MFMRSDTLDEGGDGTTTVLDWSVDANGILSITDPVDAAVITIEKVGGSLGIISIKVSQGTEELVGSFLVPGSGVAMDLTGENGRSFEIVNGFGTTLATFYDNGRVTRVFDGLVYADSWSLDASGSLLTFGMRTASL